MKKKISKLFLAFPLFTLILGISSCMEKKPDDSKDVAEEKNETKFDDKKETDAQFLVNAAAISIEEISLGQLAQQNGKTTHVKELGKMMVTEHTKSLAGLTELARSKNITIPVAQTESGQAAYKTLSEKPAGEFDMAYADMMVNGHQDAVRLFEKAATGSTDPDISSWATATLPGLRLHLEHSLTCQKECSKM